MRIVRLLYIYSILSFLAAQWSYAQQIDLKFQHITSEQGLAQNTIHGIVKDKYGFMWFGTWGGLCRYDGYTFKTYRYNSKDKNSINNNRIHNLIIDENHNIWISTFDEQQVCRYNYEKDNFDRISIRSIPASLVKILNHKYHVETVTCDYRQYRWKIEHPSNSLLQTNLYTKQTKVYENNQANPRSLNDPYVTDIYKDNHQIFWVGTFSSGINKADLNAKPFEYYFHNPINKNSIIDNNVRAICEDNADNLWIGTRDRGITVINKNGTYRHISSQQSGNTINDDKIRRIFCDSRGVIWIGTKEGLNSYNPNTGTFKKFDKEGLKGINVFGITEDNENNIWFATWNGIYKYIVSGNKLINFDPTLTLKNPHARVIIHDRKKQLWVGTEGGGISVLQPLLGKGDFKVVKYLLHNPNQINSLSDNRINCLYEDKDGFIWIGNGNGLDRYDPKTEKFIHFSGNNDVTDSPISAIIEDDNDYLWISHKKGISQLNRKTFKLRNFTLQDGLQSNEFADGAAYKSRFYNKLFFGGTNGFNVFNPDSILPEKTVPNTVLTNLQILNKTVHINEKINGRIILSKPLYLTQELELNAGDKSVAIEFAGLHYSNPKANKYKYKLEGFDKDWVSTDASRRIATYSNLDAGNYVFKVMSSNCDGVWNTNPAIMKIVVKPPFWANIWAYMLYLGVLLVLLYLYHTYSLRLSKLKAKLSYESLYREKENELNQSKLQFFTNISHEIKTPLTLILAPVEKLTDKFRENKNVFSELSTMKTNGDRLLKLINQLLDFRKLETGNLELKKQRKDIVHFLNDVLESFKPLAEVKKVKLEFIHEKDLYYFFFDEDVLEKVLSNLLSNALKFTPATQIIQLKLIVTQEPIKDEIYIELKNSGKFIPENEREKIFKPFQQGSGNKEGGSGLGLAYSKALIELHGGTIKVESAKLNDNLGETSFILQFPIVNQETDLITEEKPIEFVEESLNTLEGDELLADNHDTENAAHKKHLVLVNGKVPVVLIVEDNIDLRTYLKNQFEGLYQIIEAENGEQGFEIAAQEIPDLIISDVMMPIMDGFEFCEKIKKTTKTAHIPVILLTARTQVADKIEGIEMGADDYITKPFNLSLLTAKVKNLLILRQQLKEKYRKEISLNPTEELPVSPDEKLLKKLLNYVEDRISDSDLSIDAICNEVGVSRTHLYRKVKAMTGLSMAEVIKEIRFKRAKQLLKDKKFNINEISYMVGFSDTDYFRKCFKAEFGITPSEYYKAKQSENE